MTRPDVRGGTATTRRGLVARALLAGGATTVGGLFATGPVLAQARNDKEILTSSVYLEQVAVFAYERVAATGGLGGDVTLARRFADQEREHASALISALADRGGTAPAAPRRLDEVPGLERAIQRGPRSIAAFAIRLEQATVSSYYAAHATLQDPGLLRTVASIMACEAQHLVALRRSSGSDPAPEAFVTGRRR